MKRITMAACVLAFAAVSGEAAAQQKSLKERLIGTWHFVVAEVTAPDGTKSFPFGPKPRGMVIFTADGNEVPSRWKLWAQAWGVWEGIVKAERYAEWPGFRPAI